MFLSVLRANNIFYLLFGSWKISFIYLIFKRISSLEIYYFLNNFKSNAVFKFIFLLFNIAMLHQSNWTKIVISLHKVISNSLSTSDFYTL